MNITTELKTLLTFVSTNYWIFWSSLILAKETCKNHIGFHVRMPFVPHGNPVHLWSIFFLLYFTFPFRIFSDDYRTLCFLRQLSASIPLKIPCRLLTDSGMPEISSHPLLEYCSIAQLHRNNFQLISHWNFLIFQCQTPFE